MLSDMDVDEVGGIVKEFRCLLKFLGTSPQSLGIAPAQPCDILSRGVINVTFLSLNLRKWQRAAILKKMMGQRMNSTEQAMSIHS
jgi:hypothetical protein